jgi:DNA replication protein DnaC
MLLARTLFDVLGNIPSPKTDDEIQRYEARIHRDARRERLRSSGITNHLAEGDEALVLDGSAQQTESLRLVRRWMALWQSGGAPWIWIGGPVGVGKTLAAAHARAELGGRYVSFLDVIRMYRDRERSVRSATAAWARLGGQYLVVLDEVGLEERAQAEHARVALHEFVEMRRRRSTPTIALTNKRSEAIRARFAGAYYDKRTMSRLGQVLWKDQEGRGLHDVGGTDLRGGGV